LFVFVWDCGERDLMVLGLDMRFLGGKRRKPGAEAPFPLISFQGPEGPCSFRVRAIRANGGGFRGWLDAGVEAPLYADATATAKGEMRGFLRCAAHKGRERLRSK
jgi:hypothetical protein